MHGFDQERWEKEAVKIMADANHAKYSQNAHLGQMLKDTSPKVLAESSPHDLFWGTGKSVHARDAFNGWKGQNKLGEVLINIRDNL